jgi:hypothetical protein
MIRIQAELQELGLFFEPTHMCFQNELNFQKLLEFRNCLVPEGRTLVSNIFLF